MDHRRKRPSRAGVPAPENEPTMTGHERERPTTGARGPANPDWEAELRAGLEEDGGSGSVEPELAIARLLVHAHRVEAFDDADASRLWADVAKAISPVPWWKRRWFTIAAPAAVAALVAAVLVVVVVPARKHARERSDVASSADLLEQQFELLAPKAREEVSRTVDAGRGQLRGELIAMAMSEGGRTQGGAP
jgi:hypothetical protein